MKPSFLRSWSILQAKSVLAVAIAIAGVSMTTGCGSLVSDRCEQICKCENCGERAQQECEDEVQAEVDIASAYQCTDLLTPYYDCEIQKYQCNDEQYSDDNKQCKDQLDQYNECLNAESSRRPGPYGKPSNGKD